MNIYVLEYNGSYTGGGIVALAESVEQLCKLLQQHTEEQALVLDEHEVEIHNNLYRIPAYSADSITEEKFKALLKTLSQSLQTRINKIDIDSYSYRSDGSVRLDWLIAKLNLKDGLYIVASYPLLDKTTEAKIVSDTYYTG